MQLEKKLAVLRASLHENVSPDVQKIMGDHMSSLRTSGAMDKVIKVGAKVPPFSLIDQRGQAVSSISMLKKGPLVVSFARGAWSPFCFEDVSAQNKVMPEIHAAGFNLVVISPQSAHRNAAHAEESGLKMDLLFDHDNQIGIGFGVVYDFPEDLIAVYKEVFKLDISAINDSSKWQLPMAARFVIAQDGTVVDAKVNPDYRFRPEPADTVALVQRLAAAASPNKRWIGGFA